MSVNLPVLYEPGLSTSDMEALRAAVAALERQSFAGRIARMTGRQMGIPIPAEVHRVAMDAAQKALATSLKVALASLEGAPSGDTTRFHKRLAAVAGGVGGAVGLASLPFELPVSTTIMLRSIADIARNEGENLRRRKQASPVSKSSRWAATRATISSKAVISRFADYWRSR